MERIYARKCEISPLTPDESNLFIENNHNQGKVRVTTALVSLGLFFEDELLAVMQFCHPRTSAMQRRYTTELLRLATKKGVRIAGGASKLVSHYKKNYNPADIFTYQDTTGEVTSVYEHCGFTLVSQAKKKEYLVAPGKTIATGSRKEVLGMFYATRYGPDRILGTKLGEIFREDGETRKSNRDIFIEDLGWHIEETSGDRVYEWFNPDVTFYTYKITATDSDKYYFGVSHVKKSNATVEDCLNDGYYGSGGEKLINWQRKHRIQVKEIISLHHKKVDAFEQEKHIVGNLYKVDLNCLNIQKGGRRLAPPNKNITLNFCSIHGSTKHRGDTCLKCVAYRLKLEICPIHGESLFRGENCSKCQAEKLLTTADCKIHGKATHRKDKCLKCSSAKAFTLKDCLIHGETKHRGEHCAKCLNLKSVSVQQCPIHGESKHQGGACSKCTSIATIVKKECSIHGEVNHKGGKCLTCKAAANLVKQECPIHGEVNFRGPTCLVCMNQKSVKLKECSIHGESKHQGDICAACSVKKQITNKICSLHGETKHRGSACIKCTNAPVEKLCKVHGLTLHRGESCFKCVAAKSETMENCPHHGNVAHRSGACRSCMNIKRIHTRYHSDKKKDTCTFCSTIN